jgi:nicotinate-nucleotide adenylyltransferase
MKHEKIVHHRANWVRPPGPVAPGLKIGLLGGSFNPAHEGHLHVAETALKRLGLDYVWWLVTPHNPLKPTVGLAALPDRIEQAKAIARHPRIVVVDLELALGTRYTIDTLKALNRRFPRTKFIWLMGSDNLAGFQNWHRWPEIIQQVPIAVIMRPGSVMAPLYSHAIHRFAVRRLRDGRICRSEAPAITVVDGKRNAQSSSAIRAASESDVALVHAIPPC